MQFLEKFKPLGLLVLRVALGASFLFMWISEVERSGARIQIISRIRPSELFRLYFGDSGSVWRRIADRRIIYARRGSVAGHRDGAGARPIHRPVR